MGTGDRSERRARPGKLPVLLTALLLAVGAGVAFVTVAPAAADPVEDCTPTRGAVVAVDFAPFGGGLVRGCDLTPTTGYELLRESGFTTTGTQHDGPGFLCRIGHRSYASGTEYPTPDREDCVLTPQATAYWSYWIASPGQSRWRYSPLGAMSRTPKDGDVDAWVFGGTDVGGSTGRPSFTPDEVRAGGGVTPGPSVTPSATPSASPSPTGPSGSVDLDAAAEWVRGRLTDGDHIAVDGSDEPDHMLTTEAAFALAAADGSGTALDKVTAFMAGRTDAYAYPGGDGEAPDTNAAARLALLASATGGDPRDMGGHDLVGDLTKHVCDKGPDDGAGPECTAVGDFRSAGYADGQALAVLALLRAGLEPPAASVSRLAALQCEDGGVSSVLIRPGENCDGDPGTTGLVALVLDRAGGHTGTVDRAKRYLLGAQLASGAFPGYTGSTTGTAWTTGYAAQALRALGETGPADAAVGWLGTQQLPDGGFAFEEGGTDAAVYATSPAVLAGAGTSLLTLTREAPQPTGTPTGPSPTPPTSPPPSPTGPSSPTPTGPSPTPPTSPPPSPTGPSPTGPTTTPPPRPPGTTPDLRKGVAYLTGRANLVGGRYYESAGGGGRADFGLTIDGAYALAATGLDNDALRGVVDFLDTGEDVTGRAVHDWTGVGRGAVVGGALGKTALLAVAVGRDPRDFGGQDLVAALKDAVCKAPSTAPDRSCAAKGAYTNAQSVFSQSLGVIAQIRAGDEEAAREPLGYLRGLQRDSGAWPSLIPATGDADVDSTAMAAMAVDTADGGDTDRVVSKALAWIADQQLPDGGFPGAAGNSVNSAALAVQGLSLAPATYEAEITKALKFLASQQNRDGGFNVAKGGQPGSDLRASTQAVGGATGTSFGELTRDLTDTSPQPTRPGPGPTSSPGPDPSSTPGIVTPGDPGGATGSGGANGSNGTGGSGGSGNATGSTGGSGSGTGGGSGTDGGTGAHGAAGDGGALASTGGQVGLFALLATGLVLAGWRTVVVARRRTAADGGTR
ncbi:prenyltransferase/squalene oxidase repeat-containing protein [Streptomyces uncialis]|uniref:prenyltransferase/squalene oxidase repeat-containing protein n=1 Tax=Streptomyces uncialis TaxID=1048205 RepID=UPI003867F753